MAVLSKELRYWYDLKIIGSKLFDSKIENANIITKH